MQAVLDPESRRAQTTGSEVVEPAGRRQTEMEPVRKAVVDRIRGEIRAGTYLTDEKLDVAVDRLVRHARQDLARESVRRPISIETMTPPSRLRPAR